MESGQTASIFFTYEIITGCLFSKILRKFLLFF